MATFSSSRVAATFPDFESHAAGLLCRAWGSIAIAANPIAADIYQFCRIPAGSVVVGGWVMAPDMDTGIETLDMDIGWAANGVEAADPDGFGNLGVMTGDVVTNYKPVAGTMIPFQGVLLTAGPQTFTRATTIEMVANVTAATFAAGTVTVMVDYLNP